MAITNLSGTTWVFNDTVDVSSSASYSFNFTSNNTSYVGLNVASPRILYSSSSGRDYPYVNGWTNSEYKTIEITDGTDVTNLYLIAWLNANATMQRVVNKVIYHGNTLIDLTTDTVTPSDVVSGKTFHLASGVQSTGSASLAVATVSGTTLTLTDGFPISVS